MNSAIGYSEGAEVPEDKTTDNELIAEFDGWIFCNDDSKSYPDGYWVLETEDGKFWETHNSLKYHESWDWLVPVAHKFTEKAKHTDMPHAIFMNVYTFSVCRPIGELYENIIKGIKWYNQQKLKNKPI